MGATITEAKKALRKQISSNLSKVSQKSIIEQSIRVADRLRTLSQYRDAVKIGFFMNMPQGEVKTLSLIKAAFEDEKLVFLPKCSKISETNQHKTFASQDMHLDMLFMPGYEEVIKLKPQGPYRLLEPQSGRNALSNEFKGLDLIIVPGVAFTKDCRRLGHGKGFYDDYIKRHAAYEDNEKKRPSLIGVGLREQVVDDLPVDDHDEQLDILIADGEVYYKN
ncbi:hypothetical protein PACTADRAFT_909 [Pachysolen tannophilus NRRL Y-2460]|uniref:5-formyltetrahydrofolate cyclo-ligase n=1 Tax=Pachysolen tannophilus NRRL Y-2460 TaxID=669874 RepID=A0A1E4U364_PACTA|nr:hypothetical protein PACTADRAFT_909 [Pachysolen tannophilus NRRL Y-2460]